MHFYNGFYHIKIRYFVDLPVCKPISHHLPCNSIAVDNSVRRDTSYYFGLFFHVFTVDLGIFNSIMTRKAEMLTYYGHRKLKLP